MAACCCLCSPSSARPAIRSRHSLVSTARTQRAQRAVGVVSPHPRNIVIPRLLHAVQKRRDLEFLAILEEERRWRATRSAQAESLGKQKRENNSFRTQAGSQRCATR